MAPLRLAWLVLLPAEALLVVRAQVVALLLVAMLVLVLVVRALVPGPVMQLLLPLLPLRLRWALPWPPLRRPAPCRCA